MAVTETIQKTLQLNIVSAEAYLFDGEVTGVVASGKSGELGIMPGHTALLTVLKPGQIQFTLPDGSQDVFYISGGILEVQPDVVTVLADTAARAHDLDEASAEEARQRAEQAISDRESELEYSKALAELAQASAQLRAIQMLRSKSRGMK